MFTVANVSPAAGNSCSAGRMSRGRNNTVAVTLSVHLLSPLKCISTQIRGVSLRQFITFVLILLEACVIRVLLSDSQLSACINRAAASVQHVSLALA